MKVNRAMPRPTSRRSQVSRPGASPKRPFSTAKAIFTRFRPWLPLLILLLGLSTVFMFGNDNRDSLYRPGLHSWSTAYYLTKATNLSAEHDFLLFASRTLDADGAPVYQPYSRFPIGGYALIKLVILPFGEDSAAKMYAARLLFLFVFVGSAVLAWLSLRRLVGSRWIALTAVLLSFSTYYLLYYKDMVSTENGLSLFGVLLTFHGMVLFVQEGRFRQLLIKACAALLLGWHVYALLFPFIVLGLLIELYRARRLSALPILADKIKRCAAALLFNRYLALGVVALLFGMAVLSLNLWAEYRALDGEVPLAELPTVQSMTYRFGADDEFNERNAGILEWGSFLANQSHRIARATLPFGVGPFDNDSVYWGKDDRGVVIGALAAGVAVIGLLFVRQKMLMATLVAAGFCWALPMRHNTAFHDFESVFYIGIPLVMFSVGLLCLHRLFSERLIVGLSAAALLSFVLSSFEMGRIGHNQREAELQEEVVADFQRIRTIADAEQSVLVAIPHQWFVGSVQAMNYYLSGRLIGRSWLRGPDSLPYDFVLSRQRVAMPALLTPDNRQLFLYSRSGYAAQIDEMIGKSELAARLDGHFHVHLSGDRLIYIKDQGEHGAAQFSTQDPPIVGKPFWARLSPAVRHAGFTDRGPWQWERGSDAEGWTNVTDPSASPTYEYTPTAMDVGHQLRAYVYYTDSHGNRVKAMTSPSVLVQPRNVSGGGFFLHLYPVDVNDLPDHRQQHGFDNLDFRFEDYELPITEPPMAMRQLPRYDIARIITGQYVREEGGDTRFWEAEIRLEP